MTRKRIALVGYSPAYFIHFARGLEVAGFDVHWVCALTADARLLRGFGVPPSKVLDINEGFVSASVPLQQARQRAHRWEDPSQPTVNDIILMDRRLCKKQPDFSIRYMAHIGDAVSAFLQDRQVRFTSSGRDTAMQLMSMLVCKRLGIPFVVPTRARIPQEMYGFCTSHHTADLVQLRDVGKDERLWAENFLYEFETRGVKPALKKAARGFSDVLRMLPSHVRAFAYELKRASADWGNDYARYTIPTLVGMYARRKINLVGYKLFSRGESKVLGQNPFCLYALHTQPESSIDVQGSYFADQIALVRHIARSLPSTHVLYVKVHPTDVDGKTLKFYRALKALPGVQLIDFTVDSRFLLERASLVFSLTGTIAYEAALLSKPVIVFANNFFNRLPTIYVCDAPPRLPLLINEVLRHQPLYDVDRQKTVDFLAWLRACCCDGEVNRSHISHSPRLTTEDLSILQEAYSNLYIKLVPKDIGVDLELAQYALVAST